MTVDEAIICLSDMKIKVAIPKAAIQARLNNDALDMAIEALKCSDIPNNWIPCSERLPEKEGWYITTVESEKTGKRRIENDLFAVDIALAHGHTPNKFCKDGYKQKTVAWMPFPEPYQEGGEHK